MSVQIPEAKLPLELSTEQAVDLAYAEDLSRITDDLRRGLPVLVECDKELAPYLFLSIRGRLKALSIKAQYLDGRSKEGAAAGTTPVAAGFATTMLVQLREAVRGATAERKIVVLPHLDLITTSQGGLTSEAREVIPLLYENPGLVWLGFKAPCFPLPAVIEDLFAHRYSLLGVNRTKLSQLITQRESRKLGREFQPGALYKYASGLNAVRLRKLLLSLDGEDYPADPRPVYAQIRQTTSGGTLELPQVDLERDLGGYTAVKQQLKEEILDLLLLRDRQPDEAAMRRVEQLIPKGLIFWGPPGTGKTMFAKGLATAIGAAITVVSGPELKRRWVGDSEEQIRQIFLRARQSAPAIIVFDELDSFATARGTYTGSGVEHSMVNQLLTEMDGFHREELVFVVGTTNMVQSLDPALLRPGRFEYQLLIGYPDAEDRRAILQILDRQMQLQFTVETMTHAVARTEPESVAPGLCFSGDHLQALCRSIARQRLRANRRDATNVADVDRALSRLTIPHRAGTE